MTYDHEPNRWWGIINKQLNQFINRGDDPIPGLSNDPLKTGIFTLLRKQRIIAYGLGAKQELLYLEGAVEEITGYRPEEFVSHIATLWQELVMPDDAPLYKQARIQSWQRDIEPWSYRIVTRDGEICWLCESIIHLAEPEKGIVLQGLIIDVTEQRLAEQKHHMHQVQMDSILASVQDVIWSVTPDTFKLMYVNPASQKVFGYSPQELLAGKQTRFQQEQAELILDHFEELLYRGEFEKEYTYTRDDGEIGWLHKRAYFARDTYGVVARIDGIDRDITSRKKAEDAMRYMSEHDALTGLYNRAFFEKQMERLEKERDKLVGLIICDVDGLKTINDNWGHDAGDRLLEQCSAILRACFPHNTVARIGGDEFAVIMENYNYEEVAAAVTSINRALLLYNRKQTEMPVSLSVGWSIRSAGTSIMHEVFREADNRMYAGKPANQAKFSRMFEAVNKKNTQ